MKNVTWPQVVLTLGVVALFFSTTAILALANKDVATIFNSVVLLMLSVLAILGWRSSDRTEQKVDQVHSLSNGRLSEQIAMTQQKDEEIRQLREQNMALALRLPPPDPPAPAE